MSFTKMTVAGIKNGLKDGKEEKVDI